MLYLATRKLLIAFSTVLVLTGTAVAGPDNDECLDCHEAEDYSGLNAEELLEELLDPGIRQHLEYADITLEQVEALISTASED